MTLESFTHALGFILYVFCAWVMIWFAINILSEPPSYWPASETSSSLRLFSQAAAFPIAKLAKPTTSKILAYQK